ncbi:chorismate-binding protein [Desertihabitans aurantiacus]|uniref:chorismate-binding protein n=1 Tax=Desertihabitans aurantiacus TaxID=2282477 RepID=UPI000DF73766|nr:chorismate-binding protein [Desertihabitans aurantiacus]
MIARLDDLVADRALVVDHAEEVLVARTVEEVVPLLRRVEQATAAGRWAVGYIGYEAAAGLTPRLQTPAPDPGGPPLAWFALTRRPREERALASVPGGSGWTADPWRLGWDAATHAERVAAVRDAIARGETYQANLTTRLTGAVQGDLLAFYGDLARQQRGAHHAYLDLGDVVVASASPEGFLRWSGSTVTSSPMKGTAARGPTPEADETARRALLASTKDRAENLMIVDMVRNDLSRVAVPGTVRVTDLFRCERYPTVWQLTSDVSAEVPADLGLVELLTALFPCASITGAPRERTVELLAALEDGPRGVYTGAVGMVAPPGEPVRARFNVAIRTVVVERTTGAARYGVGSGITWGSEAATELAELEAKTRVLPTRPEPEPALVETLGLRPVDGVPTLVHLEAHLARLAASADHLDIPLDLGRVREALAAATAGLTSARVRLQVERDGRCAVTIAELPPPSAAPVRLALDPEPVDPSSVWLHHKTTRRDVYTERRDRHPDADDVLLVNDRGHVTESTVANLAVLLDGRWWTPPQEDGLLPGVGRGRLLADGTLAERPLTPDDLRRADGLALVSSLRGWRPAVLLGPVDPAGAG